MKNKHLLISLSVLLIFSSVARSQTNKPATDYLNVPGPIVFDNKSYKLSWSSHPSLNFYKHEYIPGTEAVDKFNTMILMDVITGNTDMKKIVAAKIAELKKLKETNPVVNYDAFDNPKTGEYMIDFLLSANAPDGKMSIAERNVYRYQIFTDRSGQKGVLLFGVSTRSYGNRIEKFLIDLKSNKKELTNKVSQFNIPKITIAK